MRFDFRMLGELNAGHATLFNPAKRLRVSCGGGARRVRHPSIQLLDAVLRLAGEHAELISQAECPWASATFCGSRHTITLLFSEASGVAAAEAFMAALPDHEFTLRHHLVADAVVSEVTHVSLPVERMVVEVELLLLDDN